jgi:VanZ family protein
MKNRDRAYILLAGSVVWAIIIFIFCTMPSGHIPRMKIPYMDKIVHFGFFFIQSLWLSLFLNFQTKNSYSRIIRRSTLLAFVYGGLIEILQDNVFRRTGDVYDLLADILGGLAGAMAYPAALRLYGMVFKKSR